MPDALPDLDHVAEQLATAAFWNAGQNCTCGSRILVHRDVASAVTEALVEASKAWAVGDPTDTGTLVGPMIEPTARDRVLRYVSEATDAGATLVSGGNRTLVETGGWYVEPTILTDVKADMAVARDEIFGPVASVLTFADEAEAVRIANDSVYGLQASVYTRDLNAAFRLSRAVRAGTVSVNCFSEGDISTPFGGFKQSGFGGKGTRASRLLTNTPS